MLHRRSFFRSLAGAVLTAAATIYCPKLVEPSTSTITVRWSEDTVFAPFVDAPTRQLIENMARALNRLPGEPLELL